MTFEQNKVSHSLETYKNSPYRLRRVYLLALLIIVLVVEGSMLIHIYPDTD